MTAEEDRAAAWRAQQMRRAAAERAYAEQLRGSSSKALDLYERTRALRRYDRWGVPLQGTEERTDGD